jgi:uncharacterized protein YcaQ
MNRIILFILVNSEMASSTSTPTLSLAAARALVLAAMRLDRPPARAATKRSLLDAIRRMEVLQIDTIHVVARSPYVVLWSRLGDFEPRWLEELLAEGRLFEYWSHEASILPIESYPLYRRFMLEGRLRWPANAWAASHEEAIARVRERLAGGPVRSADFAREDGRKGAWWDWKPEKRALETLHTLGDLMISARVNFHRVYDLRERVLPSWDDRDAPPLDEARRDLMLRAVRALGIATPAWAADYFRTPKREAPGLLEELAEEGRLLRASIDGVKGPAYVHPANARLMRAAVAGRIVPSVTTLLSPFDPLVWDRARAKALFDFDYRIECYTPAPKRRYGYFTLPVLHGDRLVGRLDPKAHRADGIFEVRSLHLEPGVEPTEELAGALAGALRRFAAWHETPRVVVRGPRSAWLRRSL